MAPSYAPEMGTVDGSHGDWKNPRKHWWIPLYLFAGIIILMFLVRLGNRLVYCIMSRRKQRRNLREYQARRAAMQAQAARARGNPATELSTFEFLRHPEPQRYTQPPQCSQFPTYPEPSRYPQPLRYSRPPGYGQPPSRSGLTKYQSRISNNEVYWNNTVETDTCGGLGIMNHEGTSGSVRVVVPPPCYEAAIRY